MILPLIQAPNGTTQLNNAKRAVFACGNYQGKILLNEIMTKKLFSRFCHPPFCHENSKTPGECRKKCSSFAKEPAKYELINEVCQDIDAVAVKSIRYWKLMDLGPFFKADYMYDFKSIVLIRDPRSMYHSRKQLHIKNSGKHSPDMSAFLARIKTECQDWII